MIGLAIRRTTDNLSRFEFFVPPWEFESLLRRNRANSKGARIDEMTCAPWEKPAESGRRLEEHRTHGSSGRLKTYPTHGKLAACGYVCLLL
jgi:hypothetical protein